MSYRITFPDTAESFEAQPGEPLLEAAERAGFPLAHDCRFGGCGACRVACITEPKSVLISPLAGEE